MQNPLVSFMSKPRQDEFESLKRYIEASERATKEALDFFGDRITSEVTVQKQVDNLTFQSSNLGTANNRNGTEYTLPEGWNAVAGGFETTLGIQRRMRAVVVNDQKVLTDLRDRQKDEFRRCLGTVKKARDAYISIQSEVAKMQSNYERKCREFEALDKELNPLGSPKFLKVQKDMTDADIEYRKGSLILERLRKEYTETWESQKQRIREIERERVATSAKVLMDYIEIERSGAYEKMKIWETISRNVKDRVNPDRDCDLLAEYVTREWPWYPPIHFKNFYIGECKDLIFNIPLKEYLGFHRLRVPPFLEKCTKVIEARGIDREGIYRISGKSSDVQDLKMRVEQNFDLVNFDDIDPNVLASAVKQYLRQLPEPLFNFPANDRADFAKHTPEERIRGLKKSIHHDLHPTHRSTLKFLVEHFVKIAQHLETNKMTPTNIALIFAPVIFGVQTDAFSELTTNAPLVNPKEPFFKFGNNKEPPAADKGPSISQFQSWKDDA
ncbi:hypothetical protein HK096_007811, partial [Nowakowskiella sp. JEL0078]